MPKIDGHTVRPVRTAAAAVDTGVRPPDDPPEAERPSLRRHPKPSGAGKRPCCSPVATSIDLGLLPRAVWEGRGAQNAPPDVDRPDDSAGAADPREARRNGRDARRAAGAAVRWEDGRGGGSSTGCRHL